MVHDMSTDTTVELEPLTIFPKAQLGPVRRCARWLGHLCRRYACWRRGTHLVGSYDDAVWYEVDDRPSPRRPLLPGWTVGNVTVLTGIADEDTVRLDNLHQAPREPVDDYAPSSVLPEGITYAAPEVVEAVRRRLREALASEMYEDDLAAIRDEYRAFGPSWAAELAEHTRATGRIPEQT